MQERVTLRMPEEQVRRLDALAENGTYPNRSEAIRDGVRRVLKDEKPITA